MPKRLLVVGAGVIGLEIGSVWRRLGSQVTVVEFLDRILPGFDGEVAKQSQRIFQKQGFQFRLSLQGDRRASLTRRRSQVSVAPAKGEGPTETLEADVVLVAIGRRPHTEGLGLKEVGVELDERGRVKTDGHYKTNVEGIYAIGDVIAGPMLAHKAEDEGVALAEILVGQAGHVNYEAIPSVVYTMPEIAMVGRGEEELKAAGIEYRVGKFPFTANSRARAMNHTDGFVKVIADAKTRSRARRAYRRRQRRRADPGGGRADGVRRLRRGPRAHHTFASDHVGSRARGGDGRLLQADPPLRRTVMATPRAIVMMGVSGSGKTTVGGALAKRLGVPFRDADEFPSESERRKNVGRHSADRRGSLAVARCDRRGHPRYAGERGHRRQLLGARRIYRDRIVQGGRPSGDVRASRRDEGDDRCRAWRRAPATSCR